jgi:predicted phosphodiesterase
VGPALIRPLDCETAFEEEAIGMRYGVLADIHGNLHALEATLRALRPESVDGYLVAGDLVGYGPFPNECVELVKDLNAVCVAGNHDLIVLGRLPDRRCSRIARESLAWTRRVLREDARAYLETLPIRAKTHGGVVIAHGSLDDPEQYVTRPEQAAEQLERLRAEHPEARVLLLGHTHRARAYGQQRGGLSAPGRAPLALGAQAWLLNPGAVGQSRELRALARFMVLDLERGIATFHAIRYDLGACRRALRSHGLPPRAYHVRPSPVRALSRAVRRRRGRRVTEDGGNARAIGRRWGP